MEPFDRTRIQSSQPSAPAHPSFASSFLTSNHYPGDPPRVAFIHDAPHHDDNQDSNAAFMKGPKRKRLAKACDACHKSKRRCDGTAPCSNCYYATKQCTYTDASGRAVAAPRTGKPERAEPPPTASDTRPPFNPSAHFPAVEPSQFPPSHRIPPAYPSAAGPSSASQNLAGDHSDDEHLNSRKRFRSNQWGEAVAAEELMIDGPIIGVHMDHPAPIELDHALTRELTNLFFTHCHPARAIIHKPTFAADLSHNRVPSYLLHAVCALAAPLSKQPRIRTTPSRLAGKPFAQEALSLMFDGAGRLICEQNLATAQALCLLQIHDVLTKDTSMTWNSRYHDLALAIVEKLGVHLPEHPTLTPVPSPEFVQGSLEREAVRRIFWLIHFLDVIASIFFKKPITFTDQDLRLRLPVDETSFELGVHSTLPEYLYLPAVRTQYASEFGHLIRILTIYAKVELTLDEINDPETLISPTAALMEAEKELEIWANTLPEHLRFSEQSLLVQQSMFETSSNTGAWCWCCMHVYHASCELALNMARSRSQRGAQPGPKWALTTLDLILDMLGDRAKNSILMGAALWSLIKYCKRDDAQIRALCADYEESWGTRMLEIAQEWRPQPSPPQQHAYPQQQQPVHQQTLVQPLQQQPRRREARNPISANPPSGNSRPPPHPHGGDSSYNNHRSSSSSPTSFPPGRSPDDLRSNGSNRSHPDSIRDTRTGSGSSAAVMSSGPTMTHGGSDIQKYTVFTERSEKENGFIVASGNTHGVNGINQTGGGPMEAQGAAAARALNGNSGARDHAGGNVDSSLSLPSLKASGLLDSWPPARVESQKQQVPGNNGVQRTSPRRSPPLINGHDMDVRSSTTIGMPVGLQWLANESR